ncbi:MAG: hypothetical protein IPN09_11560 [Bacteroidetes bacterium]|nr:hypothetical protein [Bacteroidota bacterium]
MPELEIINPYATKPVIPPDQRRNGRHDAKRWMKTIIGIFKKHLVVGSIPKAEGMEQFQEKFLFQNTTA